MQEILRSLQKGQEELLKEATPAAVAAQATGAVPTQSPLGQAVSSIVSQNFASAERSESKYINASLASFQASKQMDVQQKSRVSALLDTLGGIQGPRLYEGGGSKAGAPQATVQLAMKRMKDAEEHETCKRNFDEIKKNIQEKTAEAVALKDENGKPIESLPAEGTDTATPMPETSESNPALVPGVSSAPTQKLRQPQILHQCQKRQPQRALQHLLFILLYSGRDKTIYKAVPGTSGNRFVY